MSNHEDYLRSIDEMLVQSARSGEAAVASLIDTVRELAVRNERLATKLADSNQRYAGLLRLRDAIIGDDWESARHYAGAEPGVDSQHLLRNLKWALEHVVHNYSPDSPVHARARMMADRFSLPLASSVAESVVSEGRVSYEELSRIISQLPEDCFVDGPGRIVEEALRRAAER
jgi:hypothetical protein